MTDYKQILVIRKDLNMRKGKIAAQAAHASMGAILGRGRAHWLSKLLSFIGFESIVLDMSDASMGHWLSGSFKKITVYVNSETELLELHNQAEQAGLICCLIKDSGLTEFGGVPTYTAVAIGPDTSEKVDSVTKNLPLL